jgi:hypothetical protein
MDYPLNYIYEDSSMWGVNTKNAIDFEVSMCDVNRFTIKSGDVYLNSEVSVPVFSGAISIVFLYPNDEDSMRKIKGWNTQRKRQDSVFTGKLVPHADPNQLELMLYFTKIESVDSLMSFSIMLVEQVKVLKEALGSSEYLRDNILIKFVDLIIG